jgi:glycine dehydrogenase subunit 2
MGGDGLKKASGIAVLNSNYICRKLSAHYPVPYKKLKKHEFVASAAKLKEERGMTAKDVAKRLLDHGYHSPTTYFPLIVEDALMIEPTETEPLHAIDGFLEAMETIATEDTGNVCGAPCCTGKCRIDEVRAAKELKLNWKMMQEE